MLLKQNRLTDSRDIRRVLKNGKEFVSKILILRSLPNRMERTRAVVVVGLKVHKRAVIRNHIKRLLRETLRRNLAQIHKGQDVVVIARQEAVGKSYKEIETALIYALKKLHLYILS